MRYTLAVLAAGLACAAWAALPLGATGTAGALCAGAAAICLLGGFLRLLLKGTSTPDERLFGSTLDVMAASVRRGLQELPWETGAAITFVVLEALHHHQPWHAGILAAGLAVYLLAVHQAESAVPKSALEGQGPLLGAGLAMVVVVTAVATVPFARQGALAEWMEIVAALAVMAVGALVVPL